VVIAPSHPPPAALGRAAAGGIDATATDRLVFGGRWVFVLVIGEYAQILWGSLAYVLPMLRGRGYQRLRWGFRRHEVVARGRCGKGGCP
jgi:hypothetical protein